MQAATENPWQIPGVSQVWPATPMIIEDDLAPSREWEVNEDLLCLAKLGAENVLARDNGAAAVDAYPIHSGPDMARYILTLVAEIRRLDAEAGLHRKLRDHSRNPDGTYNAFVGGKFVKISADSFRD